MPNLTRHQRLNLGRALKAAGFTSPMALEILDAMAGAPTCDFIVVEPDAVNRDWIRCWAEEIGLASPGYAFGIIKRLDEAGLVAFHMDPGEDEIANYVPSKRAMDIANGLLDPAPIAWPVRKRPAKPAPGGASGLRQSGAPTDPWGGMPPY